MDRIRKKTKNLYILCLIGIIIYILVDLGKAAVMGQIYDSFDNRSILIKLSLFVFLVIICVFLSGYFKNLLYQKMRYIFRFSLSQELLNAFLKENLESFHSQQDSSKVINTITNKVDEVTENYCINRLTSFYYLSSVVLSSLYIAYINVYSLLFIYIFVMILLSVNHIFKAKLKENQKKVIKEKEDWIRINKDVFNNYDLIKNYQMENSMLALAKKNNESMNSSIYKCEVFKGTIMTLNDSISNILFLGFLLFSGIMVNMKIISAGQMIMMIQASNLITLPLTNYANLKNNRFSVEPIISDLEQILNYQDESEKENCMIEKIEEIYFKNISFQYHDKVILNTINLKIKANHHYLICGESGGGKSTLLKLLIKNLNEYQGDILINATNLKNISFENWIKKISYVDQHSTLLPVSLKDNIILKSDYMEEKLTNIMNTVHLQNFLPQLDRFISLEHMELSGGELQRLNLARALYQDHDLLILDEAFSALDANNEYQIQKKVLNIKETVLCISHHLDQSILQLFDEIIFINHHNILQGTYQDLMQQDEFVTFLNHIE